MRAVGVMEFGGPGALQVVELPDPVVGPGQVRIDVRAATVNPTDTYTRSGARAKMLEKDPPPYVPGMDVAGVLAEIGPDTETELSVGDDVMAMVIPNGSHGGYSEQIVLRAEAVARMPAGASHVEAATLPMNGLTAQLSLDQLDLAAGRLLAVTGAAGCYGGYVVQLGVEAGLRVIADASETDEELVEHLGAQIVVRRGHDVAERILAIEPDGVDGLADGAVQNELVVPAVRDGGAFASVRGWDGGDVRGITFHTTWVRDYELAHDKLDRLGRLAESGRITLRVADSYPPEAAAEAHQRLEAGGTRGRLVIDFTQ